MANSLVYVDIRQMVYQILQQFVCVCLCTVLA